MPFSMKKKIGDLTLLSTLVLWWQMPTAVSPAGPRQIFIKFVSRFVLCTRRIMLTFTLLHRVYRFS